MVVRSLVRVGLKGAQPSVAGPDMQSMEAMNNVDNASTSEKPQQQRQYGADQQHAGEGNVEGGMAAADQDIARQLPQGQPTEPGPQQPGGD
ncbi:hypothetical protein FP66_12495 [Halomonas salina]|uniref:Uncharacterized protein n=1 Tax=Halomonas salina TaxID=42565 RepID=A0ABR4WQS5_9GAMM|nr:hypothetical protein FP66_12495 [Halomonas salina]